MNYSCHLNSAISDIEVDHLSIEGPTKVNVPGYKRPVKFGLIYDFAYQVEGHENEQIVVSTTRPETILGDLAVAVHPKDQRFTKFRGKRLVHPFR